MKLLHELEKIQRIWKSNDVNQFCDMTWEKKEFDEIVNSLVFQSIFTETIIERKFRDLLKPFIFERNEKTIYCKYNRVWFDDAEKPVYIFSALTLQMIDVDNAFFKEERFQYNALGLLYKPYIYEISFEGMEDSFIRDLDENKWYELRVKKIEKKDPQKIYGRICFGASPLQFLEVEADWENRILVDNTIKIFSLTKTKVEQYSKKKGANEVIKHMNEEFDNNIKRDLRVFRVGEANAIAGWNYYNNRTTRSFAFDIGIPIDKNLKSKGNSVDWDGSDVYDIKSLQTFHPDTVFISHWHMDHYKGAFMMERDIYCGNRASMWIGPLYNVANKEYSADRLVGYLMATEKIMFVNDQFYYKGRNNSVELFCAKFDAKNYNKTVEDNKGLFLMLNSTLLPGDNFYECWPPYAMVSNRIKNLVVPHHASKSTDYDNAKKKLETIIALNGEKAVICVGYNDYNHPDNKIVELLLGITQTKVKFSEVIITNINRGKAILIRDL